MAALRGSGVDNAYVEVHGGRRLRSTQRRAYIEAIESVRSCRARAERRCLSLSEAIVGVRRKDSFILAVPASPSSRSPTCSTTTIHDRLPDFQLCV